MHQALVEISYWWIIVYVVAALMLLVQELFSIYFQTFFQKLPQSSIDKSFPRRRNRHHPKPPGGRLWRDLIIAKNDRTQNPYRGTSQRRATAPRGKLCWHSPSDREKRENLRGRVGKLPARNVSPRAKGFLDRRSKRRFWLLLPPGAKVARARGRGIPLPSP